MHTVEQMELPGGLTVRFVSEKREAGALVARGDRTGLTKWPAAQCLASLLARCPGVVAGVDVVELGSGCGLVSATAGACGARTVTCTDACGDVLPLAHHNVVMNQSGLLSACCAHRLRWGNVADEDALIASHTGFHVGVASEVFYQHRDYDESLAATTNAFFQSATRILFKPAGASSSLVSPLCFLVYTPRFDGMGPVIRHSARTHGLCYTPIERNDVLSEEQRCSLQFGRTRIAVLASAQSTIDAFMAQHGLREAPLSDENDEWDEDANPESFLQRMGVP